MDHITTWLEEYNLKWGGMGVKCLVLQINQEHCNQDSFTRVGGLAVRDTSCGGRWGWEADQRVAEKGVQEFWMVLDGRVYYLSGLGRGLRRFAVSNVSDQPAKQVNYG